MSFTLVNVRGRWTDAGVPSRGYVTFRRNTSLRDTVSNVISPNDVRKVKLNSTGQISIDLEAADSAGVAPPDTYYLVTEVINGARRSYPLTVLVADQPTGIELADLIFA
jgi:hypothetical protein